MRNSKLGTNLLASLIVLTLTFLGLEVFFRTTHFLGARVSWSVPDPLIGWRFVPNRTFQNFKENDHPVSWTTNRYGWIDKDWAPAKLPGTHRIAVLGDSFVEGMQVEKESHFLTLVEKELNQKNPRKYEFMNFGRSGFTQTEELLVLKKDILPFSPDALVLFFFPPNDIADVSIKTSPDIIRPFYEVSESNELSLNTDFKDSKSFKLKSLIAPLKHHSVFISFLTERLTLYTNLKRGKEIKTSGSSADSGFPAYLTLAGKNPDPVFLENYAFNKRLIAEIAEVCKANKIRFILVNIATAAYLPEIEARYKALDANFNAEFFDRDLEEFAVSIGAEFIGLQSIFRGIYSIEKRDLNWRLAGNPEDKDNPMEIGHWNYDGHKAVAAILAESFPK